jgi:hypothetical protein
LKSQEAAVLEAKNFEFTSYKEKNCHFIRRNSSMYKMKEKKRGGS